MEPDDYDLELAETRRFFAETCWQYEETIRLLDKELERRWLCDETIRLLQKEIERLNDIISQSNLSGQL